MVEVTEADATLLRVLDVPPSPANLAIAAHYRKAAAKAERDRLQPKIEALEAELANEKAHYETAQANWDICLNRIEALEAENAAAGRNVYLLQTQNARFSALLKEAVTTSVRCTLNEQWLKSAKKALESQL